MSNDTSPSGMAEQITKLLQNQRDLQDKLAALLIRSDATPASIDAVQRQLTRLSTRQAQLVSALSASKSDERGQHLRENLASQRPMREMVLDTLAVLAVPAPPRLVSQVARALYGYVLPIERFASLRRDEQRAYVKAPQSRPTWVVPAINLIGLTANPRLVGISAWPAETRLLGARTLRVNHLKVLVALLDAAGRSDQTEAGLRPLIVQFSASVPGAMVDGTTDFSFARAKTAAVNELAALEEVDLPERKRGAEKLTTLSPETQLWGRPPLFTVEGDQMERSG